MGFCGDPDCIPGMVPGLLELLCTAWDGVKVTEIH